MTELAGKISLGETCDLTDPCYKKDVWCRSTITDMLPGIYNCYGLKEDCGMWGKRITASWIVHEDYDLGDVGEMLNMACEEIGGCGVDTGLFGYFDDKPDFTDAEWRGFWESEDINVVNGGYHGRDGFFTSTGIGDGVYCPVLCRNEDGKVIGIYTEFMKAEEGDITW